MKINRRYFLGSAGALCLTPQMAMAKNTMRSGFISSAKTHKGHVLVLVDETGRILFQAALPDRGHGSAFCRRLAKTALFARRPGRFIQIIDLKQRRIERVIEPRPDRLFNGHGFFSVDGRYLYATENDFEVERGVLGIYDLQNKAVRIGEMDSFGVGPHEALLMRDGQTIAVANGGIATHPDYPRQKLNIPDMLSSIAYLDIRTGQLQSQHYLPTEYQKLSIRHIAEGLGKTLWFGGQYQGNSSKDVSVVGYHRPGRRLEQIELPQKTRQSLRNYTGSVAANLISGEIAVSCPRGNQLLILDGEKKILKKTLFSSDICGVYASENDFAFSTGEGLFFKENQIVRPFEDFSWDNHMGRVDI
jgi:uncharacterized protein